MASCPICGTPGAYVGFNSIECRNKKCEHFVLQETLSCGCCGGDHFTVECPSGKASEGDSDDSSLPPASRARKRKKKHQDPPPEWHGD